MFLILQVLIISPPSLVVVSVSFPVMRWAAVYPSQSTSTARLIFITSTSTVQSGGVHLARCGVFFYVLGFSKVVQVRVVEHKKTKVVYALKYIEKSQCIRQRAVANVIQERRLLEEVGMNDLHQATLLLRMTLADRSCFRRESTLRFPG